MQYYPSAAAAFRLGSYLLYALPSHLLSSDFASTFLNYPCTCGRCVRFLLRSITRSPPPLCKAASRTPPRRRPSARSILRRSDRAETPCRPSVDRTPRLTEISEFWVCCGFLREDEAAAAVVYKGGRRLGMESVLGPDSRWALHQHITAVRCGCEPFQKNKSDTPFYP
jgi:hypothetical protein